MPKDKTDPIIFKDVDEIDSLEWFNQIITEKGADGHFVHPHVAFVIFVTNPPCPACVQQAKFLSICRKPKTVEIWYVDADRFPQIVETLVGYSNIEGLLTPAWFFYKEAEGKMWRWKLERGRDSTEPQNQTSPTIRYSTNVIPINTLEHLLSKLYGEP